MQNKFKMPTSKRGKSTSALQIISKRVSANKISKIVKPPFNFDKVIKFLAFLFFFIWILVGLFFLVFIYGNFRQGAFRNLFSKAQPQASQGQMQAPTETTLPGIGKVNIACVQSALSSDAIQKIVTDGNTYKLTDAEKSKFEPCIVEKEQATPSASPTK